MTLANYWAIVAKRWILIVLCVVAAGLGTFFGSKLTTPIYQSAVLVRVDIRMSSSGTNSADYTSLLASDQLVQTEAQLAVSGSVLAEVASHYPGLTSSKLAQNVSQSPKLNTQLFEIDVEDTSPVRAAALANDIAATLIKQEAQNQVNDNAQSQQQLQAQMDVARQNINETNTKINVLQEQVAALESQKNNQAQIANLQTQIGTLQGQLGVQQANYNQWQTILAQLEISEGQNANFLKVAQPAQINRSPVKPQVLLNTVIGSVAGLFLGLMLALLIELLDTRVHSAEEIARLLNVPLLGNIWQSGDNKAEHDPIVNPEAHHINVEAYRILRTNIQFSSVSKPVHSFLVTSPLPSDGKSTIAANLAVYMAKGGKKTLLVDADLRHPTIHKQFMLPKENLGLSNLLVALSNYSSLPNATDAASISLGPYITSVDIPNLGVMTAGELPPNPPELLDSAAMNTFLEVIKNSGVDIVVIDTPPLLGLSDTSILTAKVDGVVVVADITRVKKKNLHLTRAALTRANARVLGSIVNKQQRPRKSSIYGYGYYYYGQEEEKGKNSTRQPADITTK
ncbi:MAG TPA: polysaccharide biosynthesis tyrosine autokinase [Ktedonobacteraceae bacterium]|nr:polysaccharide biosynthesis tyrosine autokinase [Ktedonobacteraceae bacterium]